MESEVPRARVFDGIKTMARDGRLAPCRLEAE